ncbi:hypothetical protein BP6252_10356 [Coleophoma cylindrospora]|uniref:Uncharacterized protein n=1 Tax=Coleophoma cylindrospora TaxID=1849047 RepID=A0A3D8QSC7_9HELO|nr:hypothetical protein BP6252_10356 [Coleophoma cylindrospora]
MGDVSENGFWPIRLSLQSDKPAFMTLSEASEDRIKWEGIVLRISHSIREGNVYLNLLGASVLLILLPFLMRKIFLKSRPAKKVTFLYKRPILYDVVLQFVVIAALTLSIVLAIARSTSVKEPLLLGYILVLKLLHMILSRKQKTSFRNVFGIHSILLLFCSTVLAFLMDVLPSLLVHRDIRVPPIKVAKALLLALSLAILVISPRNAVECEYPKTASNSVMKMEDLEEEKVTIPTPEEYCSPIAYYMTYGWLDSVIFLGWKRALVIDDLPPLPHYDEPFFWLRNVQAARKRGRSTFMTILILMRRELSLQAFWAFIQASCEFTAPFAMNRLLSFLENPEESVFHPSLWVLLLFLGPMFRSCAFQHYIFTSTRLLIRVRTSLVQEIYHKALNSIIFERLPEEAGKSSEATEDTPLIPGDKKTGKKEKKKDVGNSGVGHIINLMSSDVRGIVESRDLVWMSIAIPLQVTVTTVFLYRLIGWSSFAGLAVMIMGLILPSIISRQMMLTQRKVMARSDVRIGMVSEYLSSIRVIKYFGWEKVMAEKVKEMRNLELVQVWRRKLWVIASAWVADFIPLFTLFVMFTTYTLGTGQPLRAATAFTCLSVIESLRQMFIRAADVSAKAAEGLASFRRIDAFFNTITPKTEVPIGNPSFKNATFLRSPAGTFRLQDITVDFLPGQLNVITGPTGCGKTSMLLSLLGETILESGKVSCPQDVAYVSQSAWLQSGTVRENILFHSEFDQIRYDATVRACGLARDLEELPYGDMTQVAEQGAVLSGGQQQRVALARAVYSSASTLLLDDVFSALDIHTTNLIYNEFFRNGFLGERTVILVSHLPALIEAASLVVRIENGNVVDIATKTSSETPSIVANSDEETESLEVSAIPPQVMPKPAVIMHKKLEESAKGRIPRGLFFEYILCFGGYPYAILALFTSFAAQAAFFSITLWLSVWTGAYSEKEAVNLGFYIGVYAIILVAFNCLVASSNFIFQYGSLRAARGLHTNLLAAVFHVPIRWFDSQALGTILNRFSTDMQVIDSSLVNLLRITLESQLRLCFRIGGIASIMPIFALPAAVLCSIGFMIGEMYTRAQISMKRLTSTTQSPVFSHFTETLTGLPTIRAQGNMKEIFGVILADRVRNNARTFKALYNSNRWVSVRADAVAATVAACAGVIAIWKAGTVSAGLVGFSLTNAVGLSSTILSMVRNMNELEVELNSFQRVQEYTALKSEEQEEEELSPRTEPVVKPPASWPTTGEVKLDKFSASYGQDGPDVLKSISLTARPGERIGIVGRTGSGKSSLGLSLLRFTHKTQGSITIDGIDISKISLEDLRQAVTIIPQEPTLFAGDVRANLDPFGTMDETELNAALQACNFINTTSNSSPSSAGPSSSSSSTIVSIAPAQKPQSQILTLNTPISTDGSNFSRGQRQILSMARAICRRSKVVLLDEATSSVDNETDEQIQRVLRTEFPGSTIFTIAHRLKTILDYDRVLVMGDGRILEEGSPDELLAMEGGIFKGMVDEMGHF